LSTTWFAQKLPSSSSGIGDVEKLLAELQSNGASPVVAKHDGIGVFQFIGDNLDWRKFQERMAHSFSV
jgi:hypothetical protein